MTQPVIGQVSPAEVKAAKGIGWQQWSAIAAVTSVTIGLHWDLSWHKSIGRDTFWTPAHIAIYLCGLLTGLTTSYLIFGDTFLKRGAQRSGTVRVLGFRGPLGAFLGAWGGAAMLVAAPFDDWWHSAYGLDVKIASPPHVILVLGILVIGFGALISITSELNRDGENLAAILQIYLAGMLLVLLMFFLSEFTTDTLLHQAKPYIAISFAVPFCLAVVRNSSPYRWAATYVAGIYTLSLIAFILILPMFPAQPKLGPVFQTVTHFVPPKFPILLIVPAIVLDICWQWLGRKSAIAQCVSGTLFVVSLIGVEWPFAKFLMSPAARNRFFATGYHPYGVGSWSAEVVRNFFQPQHGLHLCAGIAKAVVIASISTWCGLLLGGWMQKVKR